MNESLSISSSIDEIDSIESRKTIRKSLKQISSVSIRSVTEIITEKTESSSDNYDKNFETESSENRKHDDYSESFESSGLTTSTTTKSDSTFNTISIDLKSSDSLSNTTSDKAYLNQLKKSDYIKFVMTKIEIQHKRKKAQKNRIKTNEKQIKKLIDRVSNWSKDSNKQNVNNEFKIYPFVINRLKTEQFMRKLKNEQLNRLEQFGNGVVEHASEQDINRVYYKSKCDLIRYNTAKKEFETNQIDYCDGIIKIGILARDLPKLSDDPELIWAKLLEPLKISENHN